MNKITLKTGLLSGAIMAVSFFALPSDALATSPEEAAQLVDAITESLDNYVAANPSLSLTGDVEVTEAGSGYNVVFPNMSLIDPEGHSQGQFVIGHIQAQIAERADGDWNVRAHLPSQMRGSNMGETINLEIGNQEIGGIWRPEISNFLDFSGVLGDMRIFGSGGDGEMRIGSMGIMSDTTAVSDNLYDMVGEFTIDNLQVRTPEDELQALDIGNISVISHAEDIDFAAYMEAYQGFLAAQTAFQSAGSRGKGSRGVPHELTASMMEMFDAFGDMDAEFIMRDLGFRGDGKSVRIAEASYGLDMGSMANDLGKFGVSFGIDGLEISPRPEGSEFMPENLSFNIALENIAGAEILPLIMDNAEMMQRNPEAAQMLGQQILGILSQHNGVIKISDTGYDAEDLGAVLEGLIRFDQTAAMGVLGTIDAEISGMDVLTQEISSLPAEQRTSAQQQMIGTLAMLQMFGQQSTNDDGEASRRYVLNITPTGEMMLNGQDLSALMEMMGR